MPAKVAQKMFRVRVVTYKLCKQSGWGTNERTGQWNGGLGQRGRGVQVGEMWARNKEPYGYVESEQQMKNSTLGNIYN